MCHSKRLLNLSAVIAGFCIFLPLREAQSQTTTAFALEKSAGSVQYPSGWSPRHYANVNELWKIAPAKLASMDPDERDEVPRIKTSFTPCANHAEALQRLREVEAEWGMTSTYLVVGGWPALQRRVLVPKPHEGDDKDSADQFLVMVTTAVAADATVVRLDGFAPETAPASVLAEMESIGRSLRPAASGVPQQSSNEVQQLQKSPSLRMAPAPVLSNAPATNNEAGNLPFAAIPAAAPSKTVNLGTSNLRIGSESEVAVSTNGTNIVVAQQCRFDASTDGGATFPFGGGAPGRWSPLP